MLKLFIERPVLATVISILLVILGVISLVTLPVTQFPEIAPPSVQVAASYPGANAEVVARSVATPLEEAINGVGQVYIWRLRIPFDEFDNARNYLSKVQRYKKVYDNVNSISHRGDFVDACLDLWKRRAPFGTYNVTNPGFTTTRRVVEMIQRILRPNRSFEFWASDQEFYQFAARTPRSNCVMDTRKLLEAGVKIRLVEEALEHALRNWKAEGRSPQ